MTTWNWAEWLWSGLWQHGCAHLQTVSVEILLFSRPTCWMLTSVSAEILSFIGWDPSVSKTSFLNVDISVGGDSWASSVEILTVFETNLLNVDTSVCGDFWASSVEILMFPRPACWMLTSVSGGIFGLVGWDLRLLNPTAYMSSSFGFSLLNWGIFYTFLWMIGKFLRTLELQPVHL